MSKKQTLVEWIEYQVQQQGITHYFSLREILEQAKEMEREQMRLDIEKKWKQYRIITNNEDAWSFKEWLIKQTYGGNK